MTGSILSRVSSIDRMVNSKKGKSNMIDILSGAFGSIIVEIASKRRLGGSTHF